MKFPKKILSSAIMSILATPIAGGELVPPGGPNQATGAMYGLDEIYNRLVTGADGTKRGDSFQGPTVGPGVATFVTLDQIMAATPQRDDETGAAAADVRVGRTFWGLREGSGWGLSQGNMAEHPALVLQPGPEDQAIPEGFHDGTGSVPGDADLSGENIRRGVELFGVTGSLVPPTGSATPSQVLMGATFSTQDGGYAGIMPDHGAVSLFPGTAAVTIKEGYHNGNGVVIGDPDLLPDNILSGVNLFGVGGTLIRASGNAGPSDVRAGATFSNDTGADIKGLMPDHGAVALFPGTEPVFIQQGYHNGNGIVIGDVDLVPGNIAQGINLFGTTGTLLEATGDALPSQVLSGVSFSNSNGAANGTMTNQGGRDLAPDFSLGDASIPSGFYDGSGLVLKDPALTAGNIRSGVAIFGIPGSSNVVNTADATVTEDDLVAGKSAYVAGSKIQGTRPPAPPARTGLDACYDQFGGTMTCLGTGQDGEYQAGVGSPEPRFTLGMDGTVRDNRSGLVWLRDADCIGASDWVNGLLSTMYLESGDCGLNDGSQVGDWRLPNIRELESLMDYRFFDPVLPNTMGTEKLSAGDPFYNVRSFQYWTSTSLAYQRHQARVIRFSGDGTISSANKNYYAHVWPVRDGYWTDTDWMTSGDYPSSSY
jgi:hypothetical protein